MTTTIDRTGWICPKCDAAVAPDVATCPVCTGAPGAAPLPLTPAVVPTITPLHVCTPGTTDGRCAICGAYAPKIEFGTTICNDPLGGSASFEQLPRASFRVSTCGSSRALAAVSFMQRDELIAGAGSSALQ